MAGLAIPLLLDRLGIDPALAGSVVLTTVTDVIGLFAFLGLATVLLLRGVVAATAWRRLRGGRQA